ncbi:Uncharacterised protein [uncultured archaeon]|nr:Uncharacterised protein [uncultured archaeon]
MNGGLKKVEPYVSQLKGRYNEGKKSIFDSGPRNLFRGLSGHKAVMVNPSRIADEMKQLFGEKKGSLILSDFVLYNKENIHTVFVAGRLLEVKKRHLDGKMGSKRHVLEMLRAIDQSYHKHDLDRLLLKDCFRHANTGRLNGQEKEFAMKNTYVAGSFPHLEHFFTIGSGKKKG